eukprot:Gb_01145 [translate_table: standard]
MASPTAMLAEAYVNMKRYAAEDKEKNDSECSWVKTLKKKVFRQSKVSPSDRHSVQAGTGSCGRLRGNGADLRTLLRGYTQLVEDLKEDTFEILNQNMQNLGHEFDRSLDVLETSDLQSHYSPEPMKKNTTDG